MAVNREFQEDTPVGMTFSTLAGKVGGGQQTPGFMGCGKVFLSSRKFLFAEGGHKRLVWMTKELKDLLAGDLNKRFAEQGVPDLLDRIADETIATDPHQVKEHMKKVGHPALDMEDMSIFAVSAPADDGKEETKTVEVSPGKEVKANPGMNAEEAVPHTPQTPQTPQTLTPELIAQVKEQVTRELVQDLKTSLTKEIVGDIIRTLGQKFLGEDVGIEEKEKEEVKIEVAEPDVPVVKVPTAAERIGQIKAFEIREESCEVPIWTVKLGAAKEDGGTRGRAYTIGGETCMPFHLWEGEMPHRPLVAMEVFDSISEKFPPILRDIYGDLLADPGKMAQVCVEKYGADLISVRLEGTHPEKGGRTPEQAVQVVKDVLAAVDVPLIVTGHSHFESNNEVMKAVARACAGENLLLNWVEQDNYRTIAGAALAYGHSIVAQSPIDVNIGKQMNILLTNMDIKTGQVVMDPLSSAAGYGIEYTYSVMERIRLTALNGDQMLAGPMIVTPGQECIKIKEFKALESEFPAWGDLAKRAAMWELATAVGLLYAGGDLFIMYHPEAVIKLKKTITKMFNK
jgi:acetyl-CoA decarbonylase/synthase complex subunit delta